ncbi:SusF/SusE family outer membrane protein [Proteiniphilum saccharofermentans]|uniref:SusF/SusE family outer membrane protein n=1 Tax=Proteiniphilum saccharofermentans TaxID=1642647 RepID=UPI0028B1D7F2|nr:SusF/SusE family outer membrane protein [Proteiniphilum saccharofermentans]
MKTKIYLLTVLLAFIGFGACDDVYDHVAAPPQANEQEDAQSVDGFTIALGSGFSAPIILTEEALEENTPFEAVKATATPELAEGATVTFSLELSSTDEFETTLEIPSVSGENAATITPADLDEAVKSLYGKAPNARELFVRVKYYITDGTSSVMMPTPAELGPATVTPVGPVIETEYYLIGGINGWNMENLDEYKFDHSGADVYEDPYFSILVNNLEGEFKIVPKSSKEAASWDGVFGTYEDTALEGELQLDGGNMKVEEPGWVKITLNMMEYTYTIEIIGDMNLTLYVPGAHQGWNPGSAPTLYSRNFDFKYDGYVYFDAGHEFKFTAQPNWDGPNYGDGGDGTLSTDGGAGNLKVNEAGYYQLNADLSGSPYTYSAVKTDWGLIGDATEGGWDNSTPLRYDPVTNKWTVTTTLEAGKDFKFRANNGWDINLGGNINNLTYGGDNITVTEGGTYQITLDLSDPTAYKCTVTRQ